MEMTEHELKSHLIFMLFNYYHSRDPEGVEDMIEVNNHIHMMGGYSDDELDYINEYIRNNYDQVIKYHNMILI